MNFLDKTCQHLEFSAFQIHLFFLNWLIGAQPTENAAGLWMGQMASVLMVAKVGLFVFLNYRQQINYVVCNLRLEQKVWWHVRRMKRKNGDLCGDG